MLLRIWWVPQVPMPAFRKEVSNLSEAKLLLDTLTQYDIFQYEHNIKPNYCNVGGLEMFAPEDDDWFEWEHPETGKDINHCSLTELEHYQQV